MGILVTQLLELARTESKAMTREMVDLSRLVEAECLSHEPIAFERDMRLESSIASDVEIRAMQPSSRASSPFCSTTP